MFNFLHTFHPNPILISLGPINIYWYGIFITLGVLAAFFVVFKLAPFYKINKEIFIDLGFWLIIFGIIGARFYHIILQLDYYLANPSAAIKIWQGGLAIHGAIIAGILVIWQFTKRRRLNFWLISAILAPGLALAQAIGRWGNYFNQELFGRPANLPWSIPINIINRPFKYLSSNFFHPTFLYESIGNFLIFLILISIHIYIIKKQKLNNIFFFLIFASYLILYSILRLLTEFLRTDPTYEIAGLRFPQIISLIIIIVSALLIFKKIGLKKAKI